MRARRFAARGLPRPWVPRRPRSSCRSPPRSPRSWPTASGRRRLRSRRCPGSRLQIPGPWSSLRARSPRSTRSVSRPGKTSAATPGSSPDPEPRPAGPSSPTIRTWGCARRRSGIWLPRRSGPARGRRDAAGRVPGVIIGHNDRIAWGLTSLEPDVQDLFVEDVDPGDPSRYRHRGEWRSFETRVEKIRVRGGPDDALTVRGSVHGPIVTGVLSGAEALGPAVALRWTGPRRGRQHGRGLLRNRHRAQLERVSGGRAPAPVATAELRVRGRRRAHRLHGVGRDADPAARGRLAPGLGSGEDDWTGTIPFEALPRVLDPPRGFLVTANNRVASAAYPYAFGLTWAEPYRAQRIIELIASKPRAAPADVAAMQLDRRSLQAGRAPAAVAAGGTVPCGCGVARRPAEARRTGTGRWRPTRSSRRDLRRLVRRAREDAAGRARGACPAGRTPGLVLSSTRCATARPGATTSGRRPSSPAPTSRPPRFNARSPSSPSGSAPIRTAGGGNDCTARRWRTAPSETCGF